MGNNPWGLRGNASAILDTAFKRLSAELTAYCVAEEVPHDRRISELTPKMVPCGNHELANHPGELMKVKAAELGMLLPFCCKLLRSHALPEIGTELLAAGEAIIKYLDVIRGAGSVLTRSEAQQAIDAYVEHCVLCDACGVHFVPKHHLMLHQCMRTVHV